MIHEEFKRKHQKKIKALHESIEQIKASFVFSYPIILISLHPYILKSYVLTSYRPDDTSPHHGHTDF